MLDLNPTQTMVIENLSKVFTNIPFNRLLGLTLTHLSADKIEMRFTMKDELIGNFLQGILHGGVISSVLDMAGGMSAMAGAIYHYSEYSQQQLIAIVSKCSTVDLQISYLSPGKGSIFIATAWLIKKGKKLSFCRMELSNQDNQLIAMANGTYIISHKSPK